jgi:hypothetical protein
VKALLPFILCAGMAQAQEAVPTDGALSDDDFYRLVSCAAPVRGACQKVIPRWSPADATDVSVGILQIDENYPANLLILINQSLNTAIAEVNAADAELHLTRSEESTNPDIGLYLLNIVEGDKIIGTGRDPLDRSILQAAKAQVWWRDDLSIINAAIVFGRDISPTDLPSVMLEEVTQANGLLTDIDNPYYETRSIFSETSNQRTTLGLQDIMALRRHYPQLP